MVFHLIPMRVISGRFKSRALLAPKSRTLRPTSDQVKEALFNMLGQRVVAATVLDLFAGIGNVGIEALSRGAEHVIFVEKNPSHVRFLKRNLSACALKTESIVYCGDANKILRVLHKNLRRFDIIFLDPPYRQTKMLCDIIQHIINLALVAETGLIVVEHAHSFVPPSNPGGRFSLTKLRRIGDTALSFYCIENPALP